MLSDITQRVVVLIHDTAALAKYIAFGATFLGSLPGTNLIVPSGMMLNAIGVLVGAGVASWTVVLWAASGAMIGMSFSYILGKRLGLRVRRIPLLQRQQNVLRRAEVLFARHGTASILVGYFSGPLRAPTAIIAAIAGMPRLQFELANGFSALLWAGVSILLGVVPGSIVNTESYWLILMPIIVPASIVGISSVIIFIGRRWRSRKMSR